jgi:hypothetical protein
MAKPPRPKRRKRALGCLLAAGVIVACFLGVGQAVRWWTGVVFPGTQFFYSSDSKQDKVFRLTSNIGRKTVRIRLPNDYITAVFPGRYFGYDTISLIADLPNMVPERFYDGSDSASTNQDPLILKKHLLDRLYIDLSNSSAGPEDPNGELDWLTGPVSDFVKTSRPLGNNPYHQYNAYIWTATGGDRIDSQATSLTYYIPKDGSQYYVLCSNQGDLVDARCSIMFVFDTLLDVSIDIDPNNIPRAESIIQKVSAFLEPRVLNLHN